MVCDTKASVSCSEDSRFGEARSTDGLFDFKSEDRYRYREDRRQVVEHTVWSIYKSGNSENRRLCDAAGVPRDKNGCHGNRVFNSTAQKPRFETATPVSISEHIAAYDNRQILVGCATVQKQPAENSRRHKRLTPTDFPRNGMSELRQHSGAYHSCSEKHCAQHKRYCRRHAKNARRAHKIVEHFVTRVESCLSPQHRKHCGNRIRKTTCTYI